MRKVEVDNITPSGYPEYSAPRIPSFFWVVANTICIAAFLLQGYSIYTPDWRVAKPITYSYMHMGVRRHHLVGVTRYGLQAINYDNGAILQSWNSRIDSVKTKGYTAIQYNEQVGKGTFRSVFASFCPNSCRDAILLRMEAYEQIKNVNNMLVIVLIIACTLAMMGMAWYFFFDQRVMIVGSFWGSAAVTAILATAYWNHKTYKLWKTICSIQQIPFPFIGKNVTYTFISAALLIGAIVIITLARIFVTFRYSRQLKKSLECHLRTQQPEMDPFNDMSPQSIFKPVPPSAPVNIHPNMGLNTSQLFSGIGFNQGQNASYQYPGDSAATGPSMWNTNLKY